MVKRQTTTRTIGSQIARLIVKASVCVMARFAGIDAGLVSIDGLHAILDDGRRVLWSICRIHRQTIAQLREMVS